MGSSVKANRLLHSGHRSVSARGEVPLPAAPLADEGTYSPEDDYAAAAKLDELLLLPPTAPLCAVSLCVISSMISLNRAWHTWQTSGSEIPSYGY